MCGGGGVWDGWAGGATAAGMMFQSHQQVFDVCSDLWHGPAMADRPAGGEQGREHDGHAVPQQLLHQLRRGPSGEGGHVHPPLHGEPCHHPQQNQGGQGSDATAG